MLIFLKTETDPALEMLCMFKKLDNGQIPKNKIVSVNLSVTLLDFLTLEDGTDRLSRNVGKEFLLCAA